MWPEQRSRLVLDLRLSGPLRCIDCGPHGLQLLRRMTDPVEELTNDTQGLAAAEGQGWIPRKLLVGQVRVVLEDPGGLDDVDAPAAFAARELGAPDRCVERSGEVDVVHHAARLEVRFAPRDKQIAHREVCLRAVEIHALLVRLEWHGLARGVHAAMLAPSEGRLRDAGPRSSGYGRLVSRRN